MNTTQSKPKTRDEIMARFPEALAKAAAKAGIDASAVKWEWAGLDNTWGDLCGFVFYGASQEVNERAAAFFVAWYRAQKDRPSGSYEAQNALRPHGVMHFSEFSNGAKGWHNGPVGDEPPPLTLADGFVIKRVAAFPGYAAAVTYYSGAD